MSKKLAILGLIMVVILSSCSLPGGKAAKTDEASNEPAIQEPAHPEQPAQPEQPVEPTQPKPTEVVVEAPTEVPAESKEVTAEAPEEETSSEGLNFRDEFDLPNDDFSEDMITTTQATTKDRMQTLPSSVQDGIMVFNLRDNETYGYKFLKGSVAEDVVIEAKWKSNGQSMNGAALVCRVSEDYSSWYEMRISSQGEWQLLKYDKSIRDADPYANPYVTIKKSVAKHKLVKVSGDNVSEFSCVGPKLSYKINGEKILETNNNEIKGGGMVGLGVMSAVYLPVVIQWDYFSVTTP